MARPRGMSCLLCSNEPCTCNVKAVSRRASRKPVDTVESILDAPPSPAAQAMREAASKARHEKRIAPQPDSSQAQTTQLSDEEYATIAAIRTLQNAFGNLEGPDLKQYAPYLEGSATIAERSAAWRFRRKGE